MVDKNTRVQVPRVFVNGTCIGGATETKDLHESGKLYELVLKCSLSQLCKGYCAVSPGRHENKRGERLRGNVAGRILSETL
jgi:hypothetical protein